MSKAGPERVPIADPVAELRPIWDEVVASVMAVLEAGEFILGPRVQAFEQECAGYLGVRHAIGVNSGTDALVIALRAAGIGSGDEVITTSFTFFATAEAISTVGATPIFADIDSASLNLNISHVAALVGPKTKAVLPVHLFGSPCDMDALGDVAAEHGLVVIEDVAQAFGATIRGRHVGTFGTASAFSFFPSKNLGGVADGGLVTTDDDGIAESARMLRVHGARRRYENEMLGYNSRLGELNAAVLALKLVRIDDTNSQRRQVARWYDEALADLPGLHRPMALAGAKHVYHQYTVRVPLERRDRLRAALEKCGIETRVYYPTPVHLLPVYKGLGPALPETEKAAAEVVSLPMFPALGREVVRRIGSVVRRELAAG